MADPIVTTKQLHTAEVVMEDSLEVQGTLTVNGTEITGAEFAVVDGVTAGTVTASKALVVDANKDLATLRHLTISGNLVTGTTTLSETDLAKIDGITNGTQAAGKAVVADANVNTGVSKVTQLHIGATGAETQVNATGAELNGAADLSVQAGLATPSAPIVAAAEAIQSSVVKHGDIIETTFAIDLTGLDSTTTPNDIIGKAGISYLFAVTTADHGVIYKGIMDCGEVPAGGDPDIDLSASTAATGAYDADVTGLAGYAQLVAAGGSLAVGTAYPFTALPATATYLYLSVGSAGGAPGTYTAGRILIKMWGTVA